MDGNNAISLSSDNGTFMFNVKELRSQNLTIQLSAETDLFIKKQDSQLLIQSIGTQKQTITVIIGMG